MTIIKLYELIMIVLKRYQSPQSRAAAGVDRRRSENGTHITLWLYSERHAYAIGLWGNPGPIAEVEFVEFSAATRSVIYGNLVAAQNLRLNMVAAFGINADQFAPAYK
jgi:hypothetical protein